MKKIKSVLETTAFIATLVLFVIAEIDHSLKYDHSVKTPVAKEGDQVIKKNIHNNVDTSLRGLVNSKLIIINY